MKPKGTYPLAKHIKPADAERRVMQAVNDPVVRSVGATLEREGPRAALKKHKPGRAGH